MGNVIVVSCSFPSFHSLHHYAHPVRKPLNLGRKPGPHLSYVGGHLYLTYNNFLVLIIMCSRGPAKNWSLFHVFPSSIYTGSNSLARSFTMDIPFIVGLGSHNVTISIMDRFEQSASATLQLEILGNHLL